ncbi:MAG: SpoIID/LytB domain-containing protein [Defluviitaleaceae bacterium]|nr:SpoIID/LytB domain-containing protein [Defluviitaleaceae bacterium]
MKILFGVLILLVFAVSVASCGRDVGGALPVLLPDWDEDTEGGFLFPVDFVGYPRNQDMTGILARVGDEQPVSHFMALWMLTAAGLHTDDFNFLPDGLLTLEEANKLLPTVHLMGEYITESHGGRQISYALWVDLFLGALDEMGQEVGVLNIVPFRQEGQQLFSNLGEFSGGGKIFAPYFDMEIKVAHVGRDIVAIIGLTDRVPLIRNALILNNDIFGVTIFSGGVERNYLQGVTSPMLDVQIASVRIDGAQVVGVNPAEQVIRGTIEAVTHEYIELKAWGKIPLCNDFVVYGLLGDGFSPIRKYREDLLVGADIADFYMTQGRIGAAVITLDIAPTYIRVVIGTSGFTGLIHDSVTLGSTGDFTVMGGGRIERIEGGGTFTVSHSQNADFWGGERFYIAPESEAHRLEIVGLRRNWQGGAYPQYRGVMEIAPMNGGFVIVNELCLEAYLYAVVPSEMPTFHGLEAAKVQAVTARSFAYHQFYANRFRAFGAHVDDSVISQVYNNIPENEQSISAVRATAGQVLTYNNEVILANYFSTSSGMTASFGDVWAQGNQFPSPSPVFLQVQPQFDINAHQPGDLSQERYADAFFRDTKIPGIDREFPWFRWQVRLTAEDLTRSINGSLGARQRANPSMIYPAVSSIGVLRDIEVIQRGLGGNIMEVLLIGSDATVQVRTEFNIRTLLNPAHVPVTRHDGTQVSGLSLMPSGFFSMEKETNATGLVAITFFGGGNGHGVGMSQNGARALIDRGYTYRNVLQHYYPGTEIKTIADLRRANL